MSKFMDDYFDQGYNDEGPMPVDVMISIMQDMKNRQEGMPCRILSVQSITSCRTLLHWIWTVISPT